MASAWIKFVKDYHSKHGGTYAEALKKAAPLWKKRKGGGAAPKKKARRKK